MANSKLVARPRSQYGLTLVELLVAMAISMVIVIAAVSALIMSRRGFTTVDAASQLRDNARFATDLIQRLGVQTGYKDATFAAKTRTPQDDPNPDPNVTGFNNAVPSSTDPYNTAAARTTGSVGEGSDALVLRFQSAETFPGSGVPDGAMINCAGNPVSGIPQNLDDRSTSVLYVDISSDGEPSLMCSTGPSTEQPIVRGVENFQVLYGVDSVMPNTAPTAATGAVAVYSVANRYLRADQMVVSGDAVGTKANWRRVRSLRIGMVLRGPVGSAQETVSRRLYPLGQAKASTTGSAGSAMSSAADVNTAFDTPVDSRLRQTVTFTVHLRNEQGL